MANIHVTPEHSRQLHEALHGISRSTQRAAVHDDTESAIVTSFAV